MFYKKMLKGITLIELVVSIAVSTVIFIGITGLLLFLSSNNNSLSNDAKTFYNANSLAHAINSKLDEGNNFLYNLPVKTNIYYDDYVKEVPGIDVNALKLFTVTKADVVTHYYFYKQHFGYTSGSSLLFTNIYTSESKVKIEFSHIEGNQYELILNYGNSFDEHYSITKILYLGVF